MKKALTLAVIMVTMTNLGGCGFTLRNTATTQPNPAYTTTTIVLQDHQNYLALKQPLIKHLQSLHITHQANADNSIKIDNLQFRRYKLVGTLTEVRVVLSADVSHTLGRQTFHMPVQVEQSYQYNEASIITLDQQGEKIKTWLYDHLAQRIAEQYHAKAKT
ncbi:MULTISPECIES: hypothetical protein [unclassified Moraxella]|uniref:hypothetical protein n=1 Tax=unclassified Moraxella TaxID=2685852 RepID=UPI002B400CB7|nr:MULTISPECIES: hypothetical protein [unclassified Moraxella]